MRQPVCSNSTIRLILSLELVPSKRRWGITPHALRDDVDMVTAKLKKLDNSKPEYKEWVAQRDRELRDRLEVRKFRWYAFVIFLTASLLAITRPRDFS